MSSFDDVAWTKTLCHAKLLRSLRSPSMIALFPVACDHGLNYDSKGAFMESCIGCVDTMPSRIRYYSGRSTSYCTQIRVGSDFTLTYFFRSWALTYSSRAWNWDSPNDAIGCPHAWTNVDVASFGFSFTGARLQIYLPRRPDGGGDLLLQVDKESHIISLNDTFYTCNNVIYDGVDMPYGEHTVYAEFVKYLPDETLSVWKLQYIVLDEQVSTSLTTITTLPITTPRPISTPTRSSTSSTISSSGAVHPNPTKPPLNVGSIVGGVLGGVAFLIIISHHYTSVEEKSRHT
ncbi:hypothetical protein FRC02_008880 [Tulasnella sp. 418]|nr:hypothetical protein FRC02_008880 [Tulasnella sp. 418]